MEEIIDYFREMMSKLKNEFGDERAEVAAILTVAIQLKDIEYRLEKIDDRLFLIAERSQ